MEQLVAFHDSDGHLVSAILATPPNGTGSIAVLCHGFLSGKNSTTNKTLTRLLIERGIATFRFDFFGHADSDGPFEDITVTLAVKQASAALDYVAAQGYSSIALMGSSFGGLVATLAAQKWTSPASTGKDIPSPGNLACVALKCPVVDFPEELELELGQDGMAEWRRSNSIPDFAGGQSRLKLSYAFYEDSRQNVAYDAAGSITAPTLIVQGDQDELIPLHQSQRLYDRLKGEKSLRLIQGADHQFSKAEHFRAMIDLLADWLTQHLAAP